MHCHHDDNHLRTIAEFLSPLVGDPSTTHVGEGRYVIDPGRRILGHGNETTVLHGRHATTGCEVALRFLHQFHRDHETAVKLLQSVCRPISGVRASRTPRMMDAFVEPTYDGRFVAVVVSEYAPGPTFEELATGGGPIPPAIVAGFIAGAGRVVHGIHTGQGGGTPGIHGDLKPANLVAAGLDPDADPRTLPVRRTRDVAVIDLFGFTPISGQRLATSRFSFTTAAPEQIAGKSLDARTDVLGLGRTAVLMLHAGLAARMPFTADFFGGPELRRLLVAGHGLGDEAARTLDAILSAANADKPRHRPRSALTFAGMLEQWVDQAA